jgi:hypothetical protein
MINEFLIFKKTKIKNLNFKIKKFQNKFKFRILKLKKKNLRIIYSKLYKL